MKGGLLYIQMITKSSFRLGFTCALQAEKVNIPWSKWQYASLGRGGIPDRPSCDSPDKAGSTVNFRYRQQGDADTFAHFCQAHIFRITPGKVTLRRRTERANRAPLALGRTRRRRREIGEKGLAVISDALRP